MCVCVHVRVQIDQFIPNRSAMDFDYTHYTFIKGSRKQKENPSPLSVAYLKLLVEALNLNHTLITKIPRGVTSIT